MVNPRRFYTYAYLREDGTPYYIGKGTGNRLYRRNKKELKLPKDKSRIIFLKQNLTEEEAFKHEIYMIFVLGRKNLGTGILYNKTDGGEGGSGAIKSEDIKRKLSKLWKGENNPNYGKTFSDETKRKMSEAKMGEKNPNYCKVFSEETIAKLRIANMGQNNPMYGKTHSEETKRKQSETNKGKLVSDATKRKISELKKGNTNFLGKSHTDETKRKQSEAKKGKKWWNNGQGNSIQSKECPGEGWILGRGKRKLRSDTF